MTSIELTISNTPLSQIFDLSQWTSPVRDAQNVWEWLLTISMIPALAVMCAFSKYDWGNCVQHSGFLFLSSLAIYNSPEKTDEQKDQLFLESDLLTDKQINAKMNDEPDYAIRNVLDFEPQWSVYGPENEITKTL